MRSATRSSSVMEREYRYPIPFEIMSARGSNFGCPPITLRNWSGGRNSEPKSRVVPVSEESSRERSKS